MDIQWGSLVAFGVSPWELIVRGSLMYWIIFIALRLAGRRDLGAFGPADLLLLVLVADAAQNAMAAEYKSVAEGTVLVLTLVFWSVFIDRLCYFVPAVRPLFLPTRVLLVKDGCIQRRGMRREYITREELMEELRLQDVADLTQVRRAYMEASGSISVLKKTQNQ